MKFRKAILITLTFTEEIYCYLGLKYRENDEGEEEEENQD